MRSTRIIAADCGAHRVACALFSRERGGRLVLQDSVSEALDPRWASEAGWLEQTEAALRRVTARSSFRGRAALALPGHVSFAKSITTPAIATANRARILRFEAAQNIPHPLDQVVWDSIVMAEEEKELSVMLLAARAGLVTSLCAAAERAGLRVEHVLPSWLAVVRGFRINHPKWEQSVLLVDAGGRSTQLIWLDGPRMRVRILSFGGRVVTHAIGNELQVDPAEAERLKCAVNSDTSDLPVDSPVRRAVRRAGEAFGERLQREIVRSVLSASPPAPPVAIRLLGGGASLEILPARLSEQLRLPVEHEDALRAVTLARVRMPGDATMRLAGAGLTGLASATGEAGVNLLPETIRAVRARRARHMSWLAAAALLMLALLPMIRIEEHRAADARARAAEIETQLQPLRVLARRNADALLQLEQVDRQMAERRVQVAARSQWLRFLADLQERFTSVEDVWLETFSVVRERDRTLAAAAPEHGRSSNLQFRLSGRLLDPRDSDAPGDAEAQQRLRRLLGTLERSPFVAAVEGERFENDGSGLLRFEVSLVAMADQPW